MFDPRSKQIAGAAGQITPALRAVLLLIAGVLGISVACAQGRGGGPGGSGGGPGGMGSGGMSHNPFGGNSSVTDRRNSPPPDSQPNGRGSVESTMRGGLQLGPPGRWWDDKAFATSVGLNSDQQHRMDDVFGANKGNLVKLYKTCNTKSRS